MLKSMISNFIFDRKVVLFAITNVCNCKCEMCSIWKQKNKKMITLEEAKKALIKLRRNNFGYLQITGGEPLLNPDVFSIIKFAKKIGFSVFLVTNGTLIDETSARRLTESGIDNVGVSFHHYNPEKFEKISNYINILSKVQNAINFLKKENIPVEAIFTISKYNKYDIEKIVQFINYLGIGVSFCMPTIVKHTSFSIGGNCVNFTNDELKHIILNIIHLKKRGFDIINNMKFLEEALLFLDGKNKYYCLGGYKIFYIDWNLNFYPCMMKGQPKPISNMNFNFEKKLCNECLLQCFREPTLFLLSKPLSINFIIQDLSTYFRFFRI